MKNIDFLWLELTELCDLSCVHCYAESSPHSGCHHIEFDACVTLLEEAGQLGCRQLQFIGGEPLTVGYLPEAVKIAGNLGYEFIEVFSNLNLLSDAMIDLFLEHRVHVATSVYSYDPATHDRVTGHRKSHKKTISSIDKLISRGISTRVGFVEMDCNEGMHEDTRSFLQARGVQEVGYDRVRGIGRGQAKLTINGNRCEDPCEELCGNCWKGSVVVGPRGEVAPCIMSKKMSNVSLSGSTSLKEAVSSDSFDGLREQIYASAASRHNTVADSNCNPCSPSWQPSKQCEPTCPPRCSPTCNPIACGPRSCWPSFS